MPRRPEVVVITGASAGVGRATACAFARDGAHIGLLARGRARLAGARRDVERLGGRGQGANPKGVNDGGSKGAPALGDCSDRYIPSWNHGPEPQMTSHETVCLLNASDQEAHVTITVYFSDREPAGPYRLTVPARRTRHVRFNDLNDPEPIPRDTDYASVIESDVPLVVQHTRLDSRQAENALITTIAYAADE
jgi:hypothetical protein